MLLRIRIYDCANKRGEKNEERRREENLTRYCLEAANVSIDCGRARVELTTSGTLVRERSISSLSRRKSIETSSSFPTVEQDSGYQDLPPIVDVPSITETRRNYGIVNARRSFRVNVPRWIKITTNDRRLSVESSRLGLLLRVSARLQHGVTRKGIERPPPLSPVLYALISSKGKK